MRMFVRSEDLSATERRRLNSKFGINTFIKVSDYNLFYREVVKEYDKIKSDDKYQFQAPKIVACNNRKDNQKYFLAYNIFDNEGNRFMKTDLHILRDCVADIENKLRQSHCVVLQGRRFSGKTFVLLSLIERYSSFNIFYFPSNISQGEGMISKLINESKNSIFLFDSNSLRSHAYKQVANSQEQIVENGNKVVMALNFNDSYFVEGISAAIVRVPNSFSRNENKQLNPQLDKHSWIQRKDRWSNIDYLVKLKENVDKLPVPLLDTHNTNSLSLEEKLLLYALYIRDKIYYSEIAALNISYKDVDYLKEALGGIIETVPVTKADGKSHCVEKLVYNSKLAVLSLIRKFDSETVIDIIKVLATKLHKDGINRRLYIDCIMFDNLRQVFDNNEAVLQASIKNTTKLIFDIYRMLEDYVSDDMHYWLQRAKSIYRLRSKDVSALLKARAYARKAYHDGNEKVKLSAVLTLSVIYGLLVDLGMSQYENETVDMFYYALEKNSLNTAHLEKHYHQIIKICKKQQWSEDYKMKEKASKILRKLER